MKTISKPPSIIWATEYTTKYGVEIRLYVRNADLVKAVVDGTAQGGVWRYVCRENPICADFGPSLRQIKETYQHADPAVQRKAIRDYLATFTPDMTEIPPTPTVPTDVEDIEQWLSE